MTLKSALFFFLSTWSFSSFSNSLTLYIVPPPRPLNWSSPSQITSTTLLASISDSYHSIGHVTAKVDCSSKGQRYRFWSGMTSSANNPSDKDLLFKDEIGMGILFYSYNGKLEQSSEIEDDLETAKNKFNRLITLKFLINEEHCERMRRYYEEFQMHRISKYYGLAHRPRMREGAGCTSYAMSYLEIAGILNPQLKAAFSKNIRVPESLIGGETHKVSINDLLYSDTAQGWANPSDQNRELFFYDTQFMYDWAVSLKNRLPAGVSIDNEAYQRWHKMLSTGRNPRKGHRDRIIRRSNGFFGLVIDRRHMSSANDDIWQ